MNHHRQRPFQTLSSRIAWSCPWYSVRQDEIITPRWKGSIKPGQSMEEAAEEKLREEVGGTAAALSYVTRFYPANGICDEAGHIFLATGVVLETPRHEAAELL